MKVLCILTDGFEDIEAIGTIAILRRAQIEVDVYALDATEATGRYNTHIVDLKNSKELDSSSYDLLFIPGGPHYVKLEASDFVKNLILEFDAKNKYIATICAGPTILGHLGLLKNRNYTCFTSMNEDFGGHYLDRYAVRDGKIITGKSAAAVIDFASKIIEVTEGKAKAEAVKNSIFYYNKD